MKYRVRLSAKAEQDVDDVLSWFGEQSALSAGDRWYQQLMASIATLETHPDRCALAAEAVDLELPIRELLFGKRHGRYRILFQVVDRTVNVLRIRHGARDIVVEEDL